MVREVNFVDYYLPPFMQNYKEPVEALKAEEPEFMIIWKAVDQVLYNHFISTADEYGISRYEKMLGVYPSADDTLEIRRMRIQNRWFNVIPYTIRTLVLKIKEILGGNHNFSVKADFKNTYKLILTIYATDDSQVAEIKYLLSVMLPENISFNIIYESVNNGGAYFGATITETDIIEIKQRRM